MKFYLLFLLLIAHGFYLCQDKIDTINVYKSIDEIYDLTIGSYKVVEFPNGVDKYYRDEELITKELYFDIKNYQDTIRYIARNKYVRFYSNGKLSQEGIYLGENTYKGSYIYYERGKPSNFGVYDNYGIEKGLWFEKSKNKYYCYYYGGNKRRWYGNRRKITKKEFYIIFKEFKELNKLPKVTSYKDFKEKY